MEVSYKGFKAGNEAKAAFARSIVHDPDIMLFDEPTAGRCNCRKDVHDLSLGAKMKVRRSFSRAIPCAR